MKVSKQYGFVASSFTEAKEFIAGLECEIECVAVGNPQKIGIFSATVDHSLRNNGLEYISQPSSKAILLDAFKSLQNTLKFIPGDPYSFRTSIHVHVNCLSLDVKQARNMILLYALFEEPFFMMVDPIRRDNIHCVPLTETNIPGYYGSELANLHSVWHKYTALNIKRLNDLGTMEFRHHHGTNSIEELSIWLTLLENLWKLCQEVELSPVSLNKENIQKWFDMLFAGTKVHNMLKYSLFETIHNSLIDVKLSFI